MSQYLKDYNLYKIKYLLSIIFVLFNVIFYLVSINKIEFYKFYFTVFILLSIINFLISFNFRSYFFEKFFTFYIWTGFVFFYFLHIVFFDQKYSFNIGSFDFTNPLHLRELYSVLIFFNLGIFVSLFISRKYLPFDYKFKDLKLSSFFKLKTNFILLILFIIIFSIFFLNYHYKLFDYYYFAESRYSFLTDSFLKWFFLFGFTSIMCVFLDLKLIKKNLSKLFYIICFQEFLFYFSILSRGCIFNSLAIFFALISKNYINQKYSLKFIFFTFFYIIILFGINFFILIDQRGGDNQENFKNYRGSSNIQLDHSNNFTFINLSTINIKNNNNVTSIKVRNLAEKNNDLSKKYTLEEFETKFKRLIFVVKNRIFGIDSLMAIVSYDKKDFGLFKSSLKEDFNPGKISFFDKIRLQNDENELTNNVTLPSIIGFLYYSGSKLFVFVLIILIMLFFNLIEKFNIVLNKNVYLSALVGQLLAYRLWHFGYAPINSYKFLLSIILTILICFFLSKILLKLKIVKR